MFKFIKNGKPVYHQPVPTHPAIINKLGETNNLMDKYVDFSYKNKGYGTVFNADFMLKLFK